MNLKLYSSSFCLETKKVAKKNSSLHEIDKKIELKSKNK
jgi:hypothetical protein